MTTITCPHCNKQFESDVVEWMDAHLAASEIGLQAATITYACKQGHIDGARKHGNQWKFTRTEWEAYLDRRRWITVANASFTSGIPRSEIIAAARAGHIEGARLYGKKWKFSQDAWQAYLAQRKTK